MADMTLTPTTPLAEYEKSFGATRLSEATGLALVSIAIPIGGEAALAQEIGRAFGLEMPDALTVSTGAGRHLLRLSADQLMMVWPDTAADPSQAVRHALGTTGYVTDQTGAWAVLDLNGPLTGAVLERISPLDHDPGSFPAGRFARTVMEHLSVVVISLGPDHMRLMSASSSAGSFLHMVETTLHYVSD